MRATWQSLHLSTFPAPPPSKVISLYRPILHFPDRLVRSGYLSSSGEHRSIPLEGHLGYATCTPSPLLSPTLRDCSVVRNQRCRWKESEGGRLWGSWRQIAGRNSAPVGANADLAAILTEDGQEITVHTRVDSTCDVTSGKTAFISETPGGKTTGIDLDEALARLLQVSSPMRDAIHVPYGV